MVEISLLGYDFDKLDLAKNSTRQQIEKYAREKLRDINQSQRRLSKVGSLRTRYEINFFQIQTQSPLKLNL